MNLSIRNTIILSLVFVSVLAVSVQSTVLSYLSSNTTEVLGQERADAVFDTAESVIKSQADMAYAIASTIASKENLMRAWANGNRDKLLELSAPMRTGLIEALNVGPIVFQSAPAVPFLRVQKPERFGDDIAGARPEVVRANNERVALRGLSSGKLSGLGVRGIAPAYYDGQHLGSVDVGLTFSAEFGRALFQKVKESLDVELALFTTGREGELTIAAATSDQVFATTDQYKDVLAGNPLTVRTELGDRPVFVMMRALTDINNRRVAVLAIAIDRSTIVSANRDKVAATAIVGVIILLVCGVAGYLFSRPALKALSRVGQATREVANGNLDIEIIDAARRDEIGVVANAIDVFRENAREVKRLEEDQAMAAEKASLEREAALAAMTDRFEQTVKSVVEDVFQAAGEMRENARVVLDTAETSQSLSASVSSGAEDASARVQTVSAAAEQLRDSISEITKQATQSRKPVSSALLVS
ncbi:MAG: cache domain-containing protein [Pseudomonadota bacterium]